MKMSILSILAALVPGLIPKKAPWCLWLRRPPGRWENMNKDGNSARRCGKAAKTFSKSGIADVDMMILPKGMTPP